MASKESTVPIAPTTIVRTPNCDSIKYTVTFYGSEIKTTVTSDASEVIEWLNLARSIQSSNPSALPVSLAVQRRPNVDRDDNYNPISVIQLVAPPHCLVYQIFRAESFPNELSEFFADRKFVFYAFEAAEVVEGLQSSKGIVVGRSFLMKSVEQSTAGFLPF